MGEVIPALVGSANQVIKGVRYGRHFPQRVNQSAKRLGEISVKKFLILCVSPFSFFARQEVEEEEGVHDPMLKHLRHVHGCTVVGADLFKLEGLRVNFIHADVPN